MPEYYSDGYEDYDDYEDEGREQEYEYEDEEEEGYEEKQPPKPTKEELEYLEYRKRRKEEIIKQKMKRESSSSRAESSDRKRKLPYDNYGSFFGPSQPVIAQRVIQESKSLLENKHLTSKLSNPHSNKTTNKVSNGGSKSAVHNPQPKVTEEKLKVQKIKDTRDYSFLLSDDAEIPAPAKEPPPRNISARSSDARSAQVQGRNKQPLSNGSRHVNGGHEDRRAGSTSNGSRHVNGGHEDRRAGSTSNGSKHVNGGQLHPNGGSNNKVASTSRPSMASSDSRKQLGNNSGNGPGRPVGPKGLPPKRPVDTMGHSKCLVPVIKGPVNPMQKRPISKAPSSITKQRVEPGKDTREKPKMMPKQPVASSIPQKSKPLTKVPAQRSVQEQRPKKKAVKRPFEDDEDQRAISMIRRMFGYNPNKFADEDDDDINMEANFEDIMREERMSARIAQKEDEEQLRLIEEEEERERKRRMAKLKKQKLER